MPALRRRFVPKPPPARESHESISSQTQAYLRQGGQIKVIPQGITGVSRIAGPAQRKGSYRPPR